MFICEKLSKMADMIKLVRKIFAIPEWYPMSDSELKKLVQNITEATCPQEARLYRILDCSAYCNGKDCFFCVGIWCVIEF